MTKYILIHSKCRTLKEKLREVCWQFFATLKSEIRENEWEIE